MIEAHLGLWQCGGSLYPGGPSIWHLLDWEQRRVFAVIMDEEQEEPDLAMEYMKKHVNGLVADVRAVHFTPDGVMDSTSTTDPKNVPLPTNIWYPRLADVHIPCDVKTTSRAGLHECERFAPDVDLVSYKAEAAGSGTLMAAFKYYFLNQFVDRFWHEMNLVARLPPHPNIVPFDSLVVDEPSGRVVGFTTVYMPGGTIEQNVSRVFKLDWLRQLTRVIDDINFKFGVMHHDVAPRNLLVDPDTDQLMLFDFNFSGRIGHEWLFTDRDDVKGVVFTMYEIITRDTDYREVSHEQQDPRVVEELDEWVPHPEVNLDRDVAEYRAVLGAWVKARREGKQVSSLTDASEPVDWPLPVPKYIVADLI